jgi:hypothetical protein
LEIADYRQTFMNFSVAVHQTHLMSLAAGDALKDFPKRLPVETRKAIVATIQDLKDKLELLGGAKTSTRRAQYPLDTSSPLAIPSLLLFVTQIAAGKTPKEIDFDRLLYAQELVMLIAHLDAFLGDSLRTICRKEPKVLHSNKQMRWDIILKQGNWQNLTESMIEEHTYQFGWKSISERLAYLSSEYGLRITTPSAELLVIDQAEKIRHIVIHNGGKVSQEYIVRSGRSDVQIGELVPLSSHDTEEISIIAQMLGTDVFVAIAQKFFKVHKRELTGIFHRPIKASKRDKSKKR